MLGWLRGMVARRRIRWAAEAERRRASLATMHANEAELRAREQGKGYAPLEPPLGDCTRAHPGRPVAADVMGTLPLAPMLGHSVELAPGSPFRPPVPIAWPPVVSAEARPELVASGVAIGRGEAHHAAPMPVPAYLLRQSNAVPDPVPGGPVGKARRRWKRRLAKSKWR